MIRILLVLFLLTAVAHAQPGQSALDRISNAAAAVDDKDWERVIILVGDLPADPSITSADRAESHRLLGIAQFYRQRYDDAERHFLSYLRIELDGSLDIGLLSPDVVQFFDNVKAKHAAELRALRPRARRWAVLNLVPPAGQFQNRQPVKGWVLAGLGTTLLATNLTTYLLLDSMCSDVDRTCESNNQSQAPRARTMLTLNTASGAALIGLYLYGVIDGFRHYHRRPIITPLTLSTTTGSTLTGLGLAGTF